MATCSFSDLLINCCFYICFIAADPHEKVFHGNSNKSSSCHLLPFCRCYNNSLENMPNTLNSTLVNSTKSSETRGIFSVAYCDGPIRNFALKNVFQSLPGNIGRLVIKRANITALTDMCCLDNLRIVDFSINSINDALAYYQFESVFSLNLSRNDMRILRKEEFTSFPNVKILDLSYNSIDHMDQEALRLMNLQQLNLSHNNLEYVNERFFRYIPNLEHLIINHNQITSLYSGNFFYSKNIRTIDLSNNRLRWLVQDAFDCLESLVSLDLSYNNFSYLPSSEIFQNLNSLEFLSFDGNLMTVLSDQAIKKLTISALSFKSMPNLIMVLAGAVTHCNRLQYLYFDNSPKLEYVSNRAFGVLPMLEMISLKNCSLFSTPDTAEIPRNAMIDVSNNPLIDEYCPKTEPTVTNQKISTQNKINKITGKIVWDEISLETCPIRLTPNYNETIVVQVGASASLVCAVHANRAQLSTVWTKNLSEFDTNNGNSRIEKTTEQLRFIYTKIDDTGSYQCLVSVNDDVNRSALVNASRIISLFVEAPNLDLIAVEVSAQWIFLRWNKSASEMLSGEYILEYFSFSDSKRRFSYLPTVSTVFRLTHLEPSTNYTLCLLYRRSNEILFRRCIDARTTSKSIGFGAAVFYAILASLLLILSALGILCVIKFIRHYCFIWQEAKHSGRLMDTWSTMGFFDRSGRNSLESVAAVTFENSNILDKTSGERNKALKRRQMETTFNSIITTEHADI